MVRFPRISDMEIPRDSEGNKLCRQCESLVPTGRKAYCSKKCMSRFNRDHTWKFVRSDVLRSAGYRCSICGRRYTKAFLDVDHIVPVQMGGALFDKENLRPLCKDCHKAKTKLDRDALRSI